jgi:hypothetical protein
MRMKRRKKTTLLMGRFSTARWRIITTSATKRLFTTI